MAAHTIKLMPKRGAVLPPGAKIQSGDTLVWDNMTDRGRAVIFSVWPFTEVPETIRVPGKAVDEGQGRGRSKTYTIAVHSSATDYSYVINPTINPDDGPPDEPSISVEP